MMSYVIFMLCVANLLMLRTASISSVSSLALSPSSSKYEYVRIVERLTTGPDCTGTMTTVTMMFERVQSWRASIDCFAIPLTLKRMYH